MALEKFSKHQKVILIIIAAALVLPLGVAGILQSILARRRTVVASLFDEDVSELDLMTFSEHWRAIGRANPRAAKQMGFDERDFIENYYVLTEIARRAGMRVSDEDVATQAIALLQMPPNVDRRVYQREVLNRTGVAANVFEQAVRELIMCRNLRVLYVQSLKVTQAELQGFYDERFSQIKLHLATVPADLFKDDITAPSEGDIRERYERERDAEWLQIPRRLRLAYLAALYETWVPLVTVTEVDLQVHYDENKDRYLIEEPPASQPASAPASDVEGPTATAGASDEEGGVIESTVAATDVQEDVPASQPAPRYRPFDEVKGDIERIIRQRRAREAAAALVMKAWQEAHELGMDEAGKLNGLVQGETPLFTRDEAGDVDVIGTPLRRSSDEDSLWSIAAGLEEGQISLSRNDEGEYVIRLIEDEPARPPTMEEARDDLRERILTERMIDAALAAAGEVLQAAREGTELEQAADLVGKEVQVTTTDFLSNYSFEPYVSDAFEADLGDVELTVDRSASPPVVYVWKALERKLPDQSEFESFKQYFGSIGYIADRYPLIDGQFFDDAKTYAHWKDLRADRERDDEEEPENQQP